MSFLQQTSPLLSQLHRELRLAFGHADALTAQPYREAGTLWALRRAPDNSIECARELRNVIETQRAARGICELV